MPFNKITSKIMGRRGGLATKQNQLAKNPNYYSEIAYLAGIKVRDERGVEWYSTIGKIKPHVGKLPRGGSKYRKNQEGEL